MSKNFRRFYETAFDSKISKSDDDLLSTEKQNAAIAHHRLSNLQLLQLSASTSSVVRPSCDVVVRTTAAAASPSKPLSKNRLFGFLLHRRRRNGGGGGGGSGGAAGRRDDKCRSSDSVVTSSSVSLESICTSDSLSSHSSESPRCCYPHHRFPEPHVLSPISDKSSLQDAAGAEISDYERDRRSSATTAAQIVKTKPPQSLGLIKLNPDHSHQHLHGSDSGISVGSKPGDNYQELLDVPFDMPKLRRKQKSAEAFCCAEKSAGADAVVERQPSAQLQLQLPPPFDMPKLRRKQVNSCATTVVVSSSDSANGADDAERQHVSAAGTAADAAGGNVVDRTFPDTLERLPFDIPKWKTINSRDDGGNKKPDRSSLFLDVTPNDRACATVNTLNKPTLKTFQNKNQSNRPTLSLSNIKPLNFVEDIDVSLPLDQQCWYHGSMNRIEAEKILRGKEEGTYLVRRNKGSYALSIKSAKGFIHMRIIQSEDRNYLGQSDRPFDTIPDLIRHYTLNKLPAKGAEHVGLITPLAYQIL